MSDSSLSDAPLHPDDVNPGVSVRNGPVEEIDVDEKPTSAATNGKRKSRRSTNGKSYKETSSDNDDDKPLSKRRRTGVKAEESDSDDMPLARGSKTRVKKPPKVTAAQIGESSDSDIPLTKKLAKEKQQIEKAAERTAKSIRAAEEKPQPKKRASRASNGVKASPDDEAPVKRAGKKGATDKTPARKSKAKKEPECTPKKPKSRTDEDEEAQEEEEEYRWWEDPGKGDDSIKWTTLQHNGVVFPPPYEPLPEHVKLIYNGVPVSLHWEAEEVAGFYGTMLNSTVNVSNEDFNRNFFDDFKEILDRTGHGKDPQGRTVKIKQFEKCDFTKIFEYYEGEREKKRSLPAAEKKALKAAKDEAEAPFMYCMWDGRKQKVGNFRVEPPGLFRGRGKHPKTGKVKQRVQPEQITINIGKEGTAPSPPPGHQWKEVKHDQTGTWLAMWQENINGAYKYVMLAANSDIKGQSDYKKFEKARELKKHIDKIRREYTRDLKSEIMADRQRATAVYLIDRFALRAGNEKGEDEADTVGCCSLKYEHVTLRPPNKVIFDFLGKDSIRFYDEVEVDPQVFKNLRIFKKSPKREGDEIFDRLTTSALNKHLSTYMQGLTAKVFRTYNASWTMATLLRDMTSNGSIAEKVKDYNDANRKVAILCNHKRTVAAGHATQIEKMQEKINGLRYQQWRIKQMMLALEPKLKKSKGAAFFALPEDLGGDWVQKHQEAELEEKREKIKKKFEKDNENLVAGGSDPMPDSELEERLQEVEDLAAKYKKENKTGKVEPEGRSPTIEKLEATLEKLQVRIETSRVQLEDKDNNKEVALGTSKINYIDPRLTVVFSKKFNVPIERFFSKTLREKFDWAIKSVDEHWEF
ncbi:DNA topoisomerase I [Trichodelitschia bisporula]|uniref:DNA topoisomerase I n=1 Tax=Trichodelitschia bisporula TaxID=703511 RepID=A0A6G1HX77_9PEZI|nr:DNA topoisomerase I [Trichodelitschia bisporula]